MIFYWPFRIGNKHASKINYLFDNALKMQNNLWEIRNLKDVREEGKNRLLKKISLVCRQIMFYEFFMKIIN